MTLRARLVVAFLALALVPTAALTWLTLDRLDRTMRMWSTPGVEHTLQSALEMSKSLVTRLEATVTAQAQDWAQALPPGPLNEPRRTAIRIGLRTAGLDFVQVYQLHGDGWRLVEEVRPPGVLAAVPLDLSSDLPAALASDRLVRSRRGALAGVSPADSGRAVVAGLHVNPDFFDQIQRVGEGVGFYRRFSVVRDVSRIYLLLLVFAVALTLSVLALWVATALARGMTRPLHRIEDALERVAAGDLEARVAPAGAAEMRALAQRFNAMTERLAGARLALQEAEREAAWRDVARRLAHEFKNLLTPMSLSLHRLRRRAGAVPENERVAVDESLKALSQSVDQMARLAEQFSQYARLPEPRFERIDLGEVTRAAVALHEHEGITIVVMGDDPTPVRGDGLLLSRAIHNLVLNACEASEPGATVELRVTARGGEAMVEVLDRGSGLDPEVEPRLFEPYVSTKRRGSGLGLSLARDIAGQHRGTVRLENREGGGAQALLRLPLDEEGGPWTASA
ncbi:MAG: HAMP domain-containing protein [Candidatus Eisenbacteria bacterium]|uniref:Signal transduction histidine-protein kinase/phosphatase MprB n=1 Tax=Eiseniibacteriota bacterium TaxID=2212470 RepID=A0A538TNY9_UNCEI|nr:MAG: HAMP domain-containing protein [Candidatus Eisenbacteria bacterium]